MTGYLAPHSDVVALMVLEHEARLLNMLTRAGWDARVGPLMPARQATVEDLVDYMLFVDEEPLGGPVREHPGSRRRLAARAPATRKAVRCATSTFARA